MTILATFALGACGGSNTTAGGSVANGGNASNGGDPTSSTRLLTAKEVSTITGATFVDAQAMPISDKWKPSDDNASSCTVQGTACAFLVNETDPETHEATQRHVVLECGYDMLTEPIVVDPSKLSIDLKPTPIAGIGAKAFLGETHNSGAGLYFQHGSKPCLLKYSIRNGWAADVKAETTLARIVDMRMGGKDATSLVKLIPSDPIVLTTPEEVSSIFGTKLTVANSSSPQQGECIAKDVASCTYSNAGQHTSVDVECTLGADWPPEYSGLTPVDVGKAAMWSSTDNSANLHVALFDAPSSGKTSQCVVGAFTQGGDAMPADVKDRLIKLAKAVVAKQTAAIAPTIYAK